MLGTDCLSRISIMSNVKKWYRTRSKIVHGVQVVVDEVELRALESVVRDSLKSFMGTREPQAHDDIISQLDLG